MCVCVCVCNDNVSFIQPSGNDCVDGINTQQLEKRTKNINIYIYLLYAFLFI